MADPILRFFSGNILRSSTTITATSIPTASKSFLFDRMENTRAQSSGSNDTTNEVITLDFGSSKTFSAIHVKDHNIKSGNIKYWDGSSYVDFSTAISWSANSLPDSFFRFTAVSSQKVQLTLSTTMVANAEKYINTIFVLNEYGPFTSGYQTNDTTTDQTSYHEDVIEFDSGGAIVVPYGKFFGAEIGLDGMPSADTELLYQIKDSGVPFVIYPCGGVEQNRYPFRIKDIFLVTAIGGPSIEDFKYLQAYEQKIIVKEAPK